MLEKRIGFVGLGQMASAMAQGLLNAGRVKSEHLYGWDPLPTARDRFRDLLGAHIATGPAHLADSADVLILAMKPQHLDAATAELASHVTPDHLVISVVAGARLERIARGLGDRPRLARVMPNTPCLVATGAAGYCLGERASEEDAALVQEMLTAVGAAHRLEERLLDAVTGLAGSGPAFVYMMIEALSDGGVLTGLPRGVATALAAQTVRGAAEMVLRTGQHPAQLKDNVTSPAGTTIEGIKTLEQAGFRGAVIAAVEAAARRAAVLSQTSD